MSCKHVAAQTIICTRSKQIPRHDAVESCRPSHPAASSDSGGVDLVQCVHGNADQQHDQHRVDTTAEIPLDEIVGQEGGEGARKDDPENEPVTRFVEEIADRVVSDPPRGLERPRPGERQRGIRVRVTLRMAMVVIVSALLFVGVRRQNGAL